MLNILEAETKASATAHTAGMPLDAAESDTFKDYFYHIAAARGSGEYALRHILVRCCTVSSGLQLVGGCTA